MQWINNNREGVVNEVFKVAVIGSGNIARDHIEALRAVQGAQLAAVVARNPVSGAELAEKAGVACFKTLREAKEVCGVNAVIICTPTYVHEENVIEAAHLGCHVLCEKPAALTVDAYNRMCTVCRENGVRFMVAQVVRFHSEYAAICDFVASGKLGSIHMLYEKRLSRHPDWCSWHRDPMLGGGGLYDINVHDIDFVYHLFGRPESVYANGWKSASGCWNHVCTSLNWKSGARALVETSLEMTGEWPFAFELRITGDNGTIVYDNGDVKWYPEGGKMQLICVEKQEMFVRQANEFFTSIAEGRENMVPEADVRGVLEVLHASQISLENNTVVKL